jgi:hypothetical protein
MTLRLQSTTAGKVASETLAGMDMLRLTGAGTVLRTTRVLAAEIVAGLLATRTGIASLIRDVKSGLETHGHLGHPGLPLLGHRPKTVLGNLLPHGSPVTDTPRSKAHKAQGHTISENQKSTVKCRADEVGITNIARSPTIGETVLATGTIPRVARISKLLLQLSPFIFPNHCDRESVLVHDQPQANYDSRGTKRHHGSTSQSRSRSPLSRSSSIAYSRTSKRPRRQNTPPRADQMSSRSRSCSRSRSQTRSLTISPRLRSKDLTHRPRSRSPYSITPHRSDDGRGRQRHRSVSSSSSGSRSPIQRRRSLHRLPVSHTLKAKSLPFEADPESLSTAFVPSKKTIDSDGPKGYYNGSTRSNGHGNSDSNVCRFIRFISTYLIHMSEGRKIYCSKGARGIPIRVFRKRDRYQTGQHVIPKWPSRLRMLSRFNIRIVLSFVCSIPVCLHGIQRT